MLDKRFLMELTENPGTMMSSKSGSSEKMVLSMSLQETSNSLQQFTTPSSQWTLQSEKRSSACSAEMEDNKAELLETFFNWNIV